MTRIKPSVTSHARHKKTLALAKGYSQGRHKLVRIANETVMRLAELANVVGIKDSAGNIAQSLELLANKPAGFSVLTGEDHLFLSLLCSGADGGIRERINENEAPSIMVTFIRIEK